MGMEGPVCPVAVISVCSKEGEITPLRLQIVDGEGQNLRIDIDQVVSIRHVPYVNVEANVYTCRARAEGRRMTIELKYTFRSHVWCLLRRVC